VLEKIGILGSHKGLTEDIGDCLYGDDDPALLAELPDQLPLCGEDLGDDGRFVVLQRFDGGEGEGKIEIHPQAGQQKGEDEAGNEQHVGFSCPLFSFSFAIKGIVFLKIHAIMLSQKKGNGKLEVRGL